MSEIFRQKVLQATSIDEWLQQERQEKKHERFQQVDALLGNLLMRSLRGERIADILQQKHAEATVVVHGLTADEGTYVAQQYHLDRQQSRGAWFLPADASLKVGILSFPAYMQKNPRFATGLTLLERSRVPLKQTDALLVWALLEAFFEKVFQPFLLRGPLTGSQTREEHIQSWKDVDAFLATLGFSVSSELAVIRYGGGWSRLHSHEQLAAKQRLLAAFSAQARPDMAARYRISCISELVSQYYKKAGIDGKAKRKQVLTKPFERTLAGFFAGDWVAFLEYIDEEAHSDEQIITALPEIQIQVGGAKRASEVAAQFDLPTKEVEKMMAAYWGQSTSTSPIEQRVALLERYWPVFDNVHAKQQSGMLPLWGFAEDHLSFDFYHYFQSNIPYQSGLYQQILPHDMQLQIEQLWGTMMLRRWPEHIVSEPLPYERMLETLGPALRFWDGCALTAWFICEGPYARTDLAGLAEYHWQELQMLEQWGTPIPPRLFDDLIRAEGRLGPPQPITRQSSTLYSSQGISTTISMNYGSRRNGFEMVRDIITHYRRTWSATYLKTYLRLLWENEIREAGKAYNLLLNKIGKAPTAKKFAKDAEAATNHWFSGDISKLYGAIQEKSPIQPQRASLLPANKMAFAFAVFNNVGGGPLKPSTPHSSENAARARMQEEERYRQFCRLAEWSFLYTQLEEALGHPPEAKDFEAAKRTQIATALNADIEVAWPRYRAAIEQARHMANTQPVMPPTLPDPAVRQSQVFNTVQPSPPANDRPPMAHSQQQEEKRSWIDQWFKSKK